MATQVVCISKTDGALGEEIGHLAAERLGFRYVDEQVIEHAARLAQVDPKLVAAVEERQPLLRKLMGKLAAARDLVGPAALGVGAPAFAGLATRDSSQVTPDDLRLLIQAAIHEIAAGGGAVIVAHAASMTLAKRGDIIRVLVTASTETRARRLAEARQIGPDAAATAIATADRNRQDYFKRFHEIPQELPTHYDVVINTDVLAPPHAAELIVVAARGPR